MLDRVTPPPFKLIDSLEIQQPEKVDLGNDCPFYFINKGDQHVINLELVFEAGKWQEKSPGLSFFTAKMLKRGTTRYSSAAINEYFEQYGAFTEFSSGNDRLSLTLYVLNEHLENILALLVHLITDSVFSQEELEKEKKIQLSNLQVNLKKTSFLADRLFKERLFGADYPYGYNIQESDIDALERAALFDFLKGNIKGAPFVVIASGVVSSRECDMIQKYLGSVEVNDEVKSASHKFVSDFTPVYQELDEAVQTSIRIGSHMPGRNHPDVHKISVVNEILGGYFGSRLMKNLREEKGYTYGVYSRIVHMGHQSYLNIGADVIKESREDAIAEVFREMENLSKNGIEEDELALVKNFMIGSFLTSIDSPFALASLFKLLYFNGLSYDFFSEKVKAIKNISAGDVKQVASQYFAHDGLLEISVG